MKLLALVMGMVWGKPALVGPTRCLTWGVLFGKIDGPGTR